MYKNRNPFTSLTLHNRLIYTLGASLWFLIMLPTVASATEFGRTIKAPRQLHSGEVNVIARNLFGRFENKPAMLSILKNSEKHAQWVDLRWQIFRAIDARRPLPELTEFGFNPRGDGAYEIDLERFPQWFPLQDRMQAHFSPGAFKKTLKGLKQRGFRDSDISALVAYLNNHNLQQMTIAKTAPLTKSFAARTKKRTSANRRLGKRDTLAYRYQFARTVDNAERTWALGLLDTLDLQRQRILTSYLLEMNAAMALFPSDTTNAVEQLEHWLLSGEYLKDIEQQVQIAEQSKAMEYRK